MNKLKILAIVLFSSLFVQNLYACAWGPSKTPYIMFKSNYFVSQKFSPLFYSASPYQSYYELPFRIKERNVGEWSKFFGNKISKEQLEKIVYEFSISEVKKILRNVNVESKSEFLRYLQFSKDIEPLCESSIYSWRKKKVDKNTVIQKINEGKRLFERIDNDFLKLRYGYQILKLSRVIKDFGFIKEFYEEELEDINVKSIIKNWNLDQYAGALKNLGEDTKSAYLFSKVFLNCSERRYSAYESFHIVDVKQWKKVLNMCEGEEEKLNLYFLRAIDLYSLPLEEIKEMVKINPDSEMTKTLIIKEINKIESNIFPDAVVNSYLFNENKSLPESVTVYLKQLLELVSNIDSYNPKDKEFYSLCKAYLKVLSGDNSISISSKKYPKVEKLINQLSILLSINKITTSDENKFFVSKDRFNNKFDELVLDVFQYKFRIAKQKAKSFICNNSFYNLRRSPNMDLVKEIERINNNPNKTSFETYCLNKFNDSYSLYWEKDDKRLRLEDKLIEMKATLEFANFNFEKAISLYSQLGKEFQRLSTRFNIYTNPFNIAISDRVNYENSKPKHTKLSIAKLMLKLEKLSQSPQPNPQDCFLLANAYFNLTYYGRSWNVLSYFRSSCSVDGFVDFNKAIDLYQKAMFYSNDKEFKAKCCFMIAKCEQHQFIAKYKTDKHGWLDYYLYRDGFDKLEKEKTRRGYREYFRQLKDNYSDTEYYNEAIKECGYLENWVEYNF
jgi:hypothetical protein